MLEAAATSTSLACVHLVNLGKDYFLQIIHFKMGKADFVPNILIQVSGRNSCMF